MATTAIKPPRFQFWRSVAEAIRGSHQDFTEGSISRAILLLATPMMLEMCMESLFAIVDVFWVTRLGASAVATVGLTESILTLVYSVAIGVSMSATAMVARRTGEKNAPAAATAAVQAIFLGVFLALMIGVPGSLLAPQLLSWMGGSPDLVRSGSHYTAIVFGGCISVMLLFLNNAVFRGAGDAAVAMRVLWTANIINLALDPCLIFGIGPFPKLGVTGAAVATLTGRSCGALFQFWLLLRGNGRIQLRLRDFRLVPKVILSLARVSVTGILQFAVAHVSWIVLVRMISSFGEVAVAGYTVAMRVFVFFLLPSWGLSGAAATMVGQNLGARKPDRAERAVYLTALYNALLLGSISLVFITAPHAIVSVFASDPVTAAYAADMLRIVGYGNVAYSLGMVMIQSFNGAGDTVTPTILAIIGFWMVEIPLAWTLAFPAHMGVRGVFAAIPIAEAVYAAMSVSMFLRGSWKTRRI
jgi:putative MATE family efflux protein